MIIAAYLSSPGLKDQLFFLAEKHPEDSFVFFTDKHVGRLPGNCRTATVSPKPKNKLLLYYWYRYKLPALLVKYNATHFISDDGMLSVKPLIPQFLYFHNQRSFKKGNSYFHKIFINSLRKADRIFTTEDHIASALTAQYSFTEGKIKTVYHSPGLKEDHLSADEIKERFTAGYDFIICPVKSLPTEKLIILLKAFSRFKRMQKTSLKLVFLLNNTEAEKFLPQLKTYKYEDDVKVVTDSEHAAGLLRAAFTLVTPENTVHDHTLYAMTHHTAVIAADSDINRSVLSDAVLYTEITQEGLSEKMQLLYKDEPLKAFLSEKGLILAQRYTIENSSGLLYDGLSR